MKRSPIQRRTPLARKPFRQASKVRAMPAPDGVRARKRPTAKKRPAFRLARAQSFAISGGVCVVCGRPARHGHHRLRLSQGGPDTPENIVPLCPRDHDFVHSNPGIAVSRGLLLKAGTTEISPWWELKLWTKRQRGDAA